MTLLYFRKLLIKMVVPLKMLKKFVVSQKFEFKLIKQKLLIEKVGKINHITILIN